MTISTQTKQDRKAHIKHQQLAVHSLRSDDKIKTYITVKKLHHLECITVLCTAYMDFQISKFISPADLTEKKISKISIK